MYEEPILGPVLAISGLGALIALFWPFLAARKYPSIDSIRAVASDIRASAEPLLRRELVTGWLVVLALAFSFSRHNAWVVNGLGLGAILSALTAYFGLAVSARANAYTSGMAHEAKALLEPACHGGHAVGVMTVSLALAAIAGILMFMRSAAIPADTAMQGMFGLALGGTIMSLVIRMAGGINPKAKRRAGQFEPDRYPVAQVDGGATDQMASVHIDGAAMAADIFATYLLAMIATIWLANNAFGIDSLWVEFPLVVAGVSLGATIASGMLIPTGRRQRIIGTIYFGALVTLLLSAVGMFFASEWFLRQTGTTPILDVSNLFGTVTVGLMLLPVLAGIAEYYTAKGFPPARRVAKASETGVATNIISGLSVGMNATLLPILAIGGALSIAYYLGGGFGGNETGGLYGIAMAIISLVSVAGIVVAINAFGTIAISASDICIVELGVAEPGNSVQSLNNAGQIAQAVAKGYSLAIMVLASLLLLVCYIRSFTSPMALELSNPLTLLSLLAGGMLTYWFSGWLLGAVGRIFNRTRAAASLSGSLVLNYMLPSATAPAGEITRFATASYIYSILLITLMPLGITVLAGLLMGRQVLAGVLLGSLVVGLLLAMNLTMSGGVWSSARRRIRDGSSGGTSSGAHSASIAGDTVGDPCKEVLAPALGSLINSLFLTALLIAPLISQ